MQLIAKAQRLITVFALVISVASCGGGGGNKSNTNSTSADIGSGGGTVSLTNGASVTVDAGVVNDGTTVTVSTETAPASTTPQTATISPEVKITIPAGSLLSSSASGTNGITVKIPITTNQQTTGVVKAAITPSTAYRYIEITGQSAANTAAAAWTKYAAFVNDVNSTAVAVVNTSVNDLGSAVTGVTYVVKQFTPISTATGELYEVNNANPDPTGTPSVSYQPASNQEANLDPKIPLVLVHGYQIGCNSVSAYQDNWSTFANYFYTQKSLYDVYKLYSFSYQFTQSIDTSGEALANALYANFGSQPVMIVAHSMGGLVTRSAMLKYSNLGANIAGVITLGTPYHGTVGIEDLGQEKDYSCWGVMTQVEPIPVTVSTAVLTQSAADMEWDQFDSQGGCSTQYLCGLNKIDANDNYDIEQKIIAYAGNITNECYNVFADPLCVGDDLIIAAGKMPSDGAVPLVSAEYDTYSSGGLYGLNTHMRQDPREYVNVDHVSLPSSNMVFTENPDGSAGGLTQDLINFYDSIHNFGVNSKSISNGATGVDVNSPLSITFSESLDSSTVTTSNVTLTGPGNSVIAGSVSYDSSTNTVTFTPATTLAYNTTYTATIFATDSGVLDSSGNPLDTDYSWSFTASSGPTLSVSTTSPSNGATGISVSSAVSATFNTALTASTIAASTFTLKGPGGTVAGTVAYDSTTKTATFTPTSALSSSSTYTAIITTGVEDANGYSLASDYSWSFTTGAASGCVHAAYAAGDNMVSQFTIGSDGSLTAMSPATVGAGSNPNSVTVDPTGKYAYVADWGDNTVSQYTIGSDGSLTAMSPATVATGSGPYTVTVDPSGKYVYITNHSDNTISQYTVGVDGSLLPMNPATVAAGSYPHGVTVDPSGKYVYVANEGGTVSQYTIGVNGSLSAMTPATVSVATGSSPNTVTVDPSGKYVYVTNWNSDNSGTVSQFIIGSDGSLTAMSPATVSAGSIADFVTVDPTGKFAYVADWGDSTVSQYTIGTDGGLTAMSPATVATGNAPFSITVDPTGKYAYVANLGGMTVSQYTIGTDGGLTAMSPATVAMGSGPRSVATIDTCQ